MRTFYPRCFVPAPCLCPVEEVGLYRRRETSDVRYVLPFHMIGNAVSSGKKLSRDPSSQEPSNKHLECKLMSCSVYTPSLPSRADRTLMQGAAGSRGALGLPQAARGCRFPNMLPGSLRPLDLNLSVERDKRLCDDRREAFLRG